MIHNSQLRYGKQKRSKLHSKLEYHSTDAVSWRCSMKQVFFKISEHSQENTCPTYASFLIKFQVFTFWGMFSQVGLLGNKTFFLKKKANSLL